MPLPISSSYDLSLGRPNHVSYRGDDHHHHLSRRPNLRTTAAPCSIFWPTPLFAYSRARSTFERVLSSQDPVCLLFNKATVSVIDLQTALASPESAIWVSLKASLLSCVTFCAPCLYL